MPHVVPTNDETTNAAREAVIDVLNERIEAIRAKNAEAATERPWIPLRGTDRRGSQQSTCRGRAAGATAAGARRSENRRVSRVTASDDQPLADRVKHDLGGAVQIQLLHEVGAVRLDRRHAEIE